MLQTPTKTTRIIPYAFPTNQVMNYFHVFISLLIVICLAVVHIITLHQTSALSLWLVRCRLSGHVSSVAQQLNFRQNSEFCGHQLIHGEFSLGSLVLSSVHLTIIVTNTLINQAGSYYVNTNFYLI